MSEKYSYMQLSAAMALNNIGVTMLERCEFSTAFKVLRSAMTVMQGNEPCQSSRGRVDEASREFASQCSTRAAELFLGDFVQIVSDDDLASMIRSQQERDKSHLQLGKLCAIRFESSIAEYSSGDKLWFPVSIILNNVGIVHFCAFKAHQHSSDKSEKTLNASNRMFEIVASKCAAELCSHGEETHEVQCMMVLTLQCLKTTSRWLGAPDREKLYENQHALAMQTFAEFDAFCPVRAAGAA